MIKTTLYYWLKYLGTIIAILATCVGLTSLLILHPAWFLAAAAVIWTGCEAYQQAKYEHKRNNNRFPGGKLEE